MKKIIILLFLAVVQLGIAQDAKTLRLMSQMGLGLDSIAVDSLNSFLEVEKSAREKAKDSLIAAPILSIGYKYVAGASFTGSEQLVNVRLSMPKWPGRVILVTDWSFGTGGRPGMEKLLNGFLGVDILRTVGFGLKESSARNKRGNVPNSLVTSFSLLAGYKHVIIPGADHHGFGSATVMFELSVTPRMASGVLSPISFFAGMEVGVFTDGRQYRKANMSPYLQEAGKTYSDFSLPYHDCYGNFSVGVRVSVHGMKRKNPVERIPSWDTPARNSCPIY